MSEYTSLLVYTLFYVVAAACFVLRTTEFVANGLTVENLFEGFVGKESANFVAHHVRRTALTVVVHSCLPLVYLIGTLLINENENAFVSVYIVELSCLAVLPIVCGYLVVLKWKFGNWANHPLSIVLSHHNPADWTAVADDISNEFQRVEKLTLACGTLTRTVVTQNWIISIKSYSVSVAKKSESSFLVYSSDNHSTTPDGTPGSVQFINIKVVPIRSRIRWFFIRIKSEDLKTLEENIGQSIQIADNVTLQRSRTERFIEVFRDQVSQNPVYNGYTAAELEDSVCAGCLVNVPDVKLIKCCEDNNVGGDDITAVCTSCQCRPMWCVDCMAKWYESRQPQNDTSLWLSSKCTCPLCRQIFCILDVCPLGNSYLAKAK